MTAIGRESRNFATDAATLSPEELGQPASRDPTPRLPIIEPRRYQIIAEVAQGGIGRIFQARDEQLGRRVALKELQNAASAVAEERFLREALLTARLQHPSIVPLYDAGRWPTGAPFYSMKYVSGRSLADVIMESPTLEQRLGLLTHVLAVAEAVAYAHSERIVHRDLKPSNVLVGAFGETVVIDWGLAKDLAREPPAPRAPDRDTDGTGPFAVVSETNLRAGTPGDTSQMPAEALTLLGTIVGTPAYMPPEQATGQRVDGRADVYALGAILYHLLAGACPYDGDSAIAILARVIAGPPLPLAERQKGIPQDLLAIVNKAMARETAGRYPSAEEFAEDLRCFLTGQIVGAHHYSLVDLLRRFGRRYRAALSVAVASLVVLTTLVAFAVRRNVAERRRAEAGEAEAIEAKRQVIAHVDDLTLAHARAAVDRDPNEALASLKTLSPAFDRWPEARLIAADAAARGVALVLRLHGSSVNDLAFSPDGKLLATASDDRTVRLWNTSTATSFAVLSGHTDEVWRCRFSPSGGLVATGSKDKTIRIWDVQTGQPLRTLSGHNLAISALFFTGEDLLISASDDLTVRVWNLRTGQGRIVAEDSYLSSAPLSHDGKVLAISGKSGVLRIYDIEHDALESSIKAPSPLIGATFAPAANGELALSLSEDGSVQRWNLSTSKAEALLPGSGQMHITAPQLRSFRASPDGRWLAAVGDGRTPRLWDLASGTARILQESEGQATVVTFSADSRLLATGSFDGTARLLNLDTWEYQVLRGFKDKVATLAFSPDGQFLAAGSSDRTVRIFPLTAFTSQILDDHSSAFLSAAYSTDGTRLAVGDSNGGVRVWDFESSARALWKAHEGEVYQTLFSAAGDIVVTAGADRTVRAWDAEGRPRWRSGAELESYSGVRSRVALAPNGRMIAAPGAGGAIQLLTLDTGARETFGGHTQTVFSLAFSADGKFLASGSDDTTTRIWDLETGQSRILKAHEAPVISVAFSPDGRTLASGSLDHTLCLWSLTDDTFRRVETSGGGVMQIAFSADGKLVLTLGIQESGIRLWSVESGKDRGNLREHSGPVAKFSISPDGRRVTTASADGTVHLWDLRSHKGRVLRGHSGKVWDAIFSPDGRTIASTSDDRTVHLWSDALPEDGGSLRQWIETSTPDTIDAYEEPTESFPAETQGR